MFIKPSHALLAALALIAGPAFAQDTPAPATPEAPAAEAPAADAPAADAPAADAPAPADAPAAPADAPAAANAPAGQPARDPNGPGSYYAKSEHGDWTIRCIRADQGKDPCEMYKLLTDEDENPVAELTMVPLSNGDVAAGATLVAPLETDLIDGLGFQVAAERCAAIRSASAPRSAASRAWVSPLRNWQA
ncbi:invasion associated locus B family protein [Paracoccus sp. PAMC 22219]|uniref:invasion associated locus B family protein n=1 Tax=Paracoccus sp. PAMC 22219 TaxID=1569209 RepID=UPI000697205A|nr:invasion associated locus B family protein [Paracoccus sp. PAMC 22219]